jgi:hypothetical protein
VSKIKNAFYYYNDIGQKNRIRNIKHFNNILNIIRDRCVRVISDGLTAYSNGDEKSSLTGGYINHFTISNIVGYYNHSLGTKTDTYMECYASGYRIAQSLISDLAIDITSYTKMYIEYETIQFSSSGGHNNVILTNNMQNIDNSSKSVLNSEGVVSRTIASTDISDLTGLYHVGLYALTQGSGNVQFRVYNIWFDDALLSRSVIL